MFISKRRYWYFYAGTLRFGRAKSGKWKCVSGVVTRLIGVIFDSEKDSEVKKMD